MKIVFWDAVTIGDDVDLSGFDTLGEVVKYDSTTVEEAPGRIEDADVLVVNKVPVNEATIATAKKLKLVCVCATGTNNLDKPYLERRGITWRNVAGYSTESVAQHTFAMLFYLLEKLRYYDDYVKNGDYTCCPIFTHFGEPYFELKGKTWGIIGLGSIGRRVAEIAAVFGCRVIYASPSGSAPQKGYTQVSLEELYAQSDIISVHAPLNEYTENLIDANALRQMKKSCIFINVGRGPIVVEEDLAAALEHGEIAAAGLDVLRQEPMREDDPLLSIRDSRKLLITPHVAWASTEARSRLMELVLSQIREYFAQ